MQRGPHGAPGGSKQSRAYARQLLLRLPCRALTAGLRHALPGLLQVPAGLLLLQAVTESKTGTEVAKMQTETEPESRRRLEMGSPHSCLTNAWSYVSQALMQESRCCAVQVDM